MKNTRWYLYQNENLVVFFLFAVLLINSTYCIGEPSEANETKLFKNDKLYFSLQLPTAWQTTDISEPNSDLRLYSVSPDERQSILIYVIESKNNIGLRELADADTVIFKNLGKPINTTKETWKHYGFTLNRIEKSYRTIHGNTNLLFQVDNNLGYILMWQNLDSGNSNYLRVVDSFEVNAPFSKTIMGWFSGIGSWIIGIIVFLIVIGILYLMGRTGLLVRRGFALNKALTIAKEEASHEGCVVNKKWNGLKRKSIYMILLPILGWGIVYYIFFNAFSTKDFLISLSGLIPVNSWLFWIIIGPKCRRR